MHSEVLRVLTDINGDMGEGGTLFVSRYHCSGFYDLSGYLPN